MKLLNLDGMAEVEKQITIGGKSYDVVDQPVGTMLKMQRLAREAEKAEGTDDQQIKLIENMVESVRSVLPGCPQEVVDGMSIRQLTAVLEYALASDEDVIEGAESESEEENAEPGKS